MTTPRSHPRSPAETSGPESRTGQWFGNITSRHPQAGGSGAADDGHLIRDEDTGITYSFGPADIVTEGIRALRTGERVRFLIDPADPGHARYIIRLDLPDVEEYYT